ncbi:hypothetical protein LTS10_004028 [Elasticomyces elasticus]|nr:hypothetical protein LTS10_004028 [Elasticomyces elasticus]
MSGDLVLITGATGHLGFRTLRFALEHGYNVRAVVRSEAKADKIKSNAVLKAMNKEAQLSFVVIPDFLPPGAFDEAVKDVKYILHIASPMATKVPEGEVDLEKFFVPAAVQGTIGVLESAKKAGAVKRVVVTSSVVSIMPLSAIMAPSDDIFSAESRLPDPQGPFDHVFVAYAASKTAAFNRAEAWVKAESPHFDVIHIHPSFILGRDDLAETTQDFQTVVNRMVVNQALNQVGPSYAFMVNNFNYVDDTARIHVLALDPKVTGNQSFLVSNRGLDGMTWDDTKTIIDKNYPAYTQDGTLPNTGKMGTVVGKLDVKKTEDTFGFKLASYETCVLSVMDHYLELLKKEKNA